MQVVTKQNLANFTEKLLENDKSIRDELVEKIEVLEEDIANPVDQDAVNQIVREEINKAVSDGTISNYDDTEVKNDIENLKTGKADGKYFRTSNEGNNTNIVNGSIYNKVFGASSKGCVISGGGVEEWSANVIGGNCDAVKKKDGTKAYDNNYPITEDDYNCGMNVITGGYDNVCNGLGNMITGHHNYTRFPSNHSVVSGGTFNKLEYGACQVIAGGCNNQIDSTSSLTNAEADQNVISGGGDNLINDSCNSVISGGSSNTIDKSHTSFIGGGGLNKIKSTDGSAINTNVIVGGSRNKITSSTGTILGGYMNEVNDQYSTVLGGYNNVAGKPRSVVSGYKAIGDVKDSFVFAVNDKIGVRKQSVKISLNRQTTSNTTVPLLIPIKPNSINSIKGVLIAKDTTSGSEDCATFFIEASVKCKSDGKTYSLVGTPSIVEMKDSTVTWSVAVTCNYNSPYIFVNITAEDSKTIEWFLDVDLTELVFTN